jgi:hypothetical protein
MPGTGKQSDAIDWRLTTWEGSRREQLRRWAELTLEEIIRAQKEMRVISEKLSSSPRLRPGPDKT